MELEKYSAERELKSEKPIDALLGIYEAKDNGDLVCLKMALGEATNELIELERSASKETIAENLNWLLNNNNRINLYQVGAVLSGEKSEWDKEQAMDRVRAEQVLAYRKIQAVLLTAGEIDQPESAAMIADFIAKNFNNIYLSNAAVDSLAKNKTDEAKNRVKEIAGNKEYGFELRTRAVLSGLRNGLELKESEVLNLLNEYIDCLGGGISEEPGVYDIIEIAGLLKDNSASSGLLDKLQVKLDEFPSEKNKWFERDIISTSLAIKPEGQDKYLADRLSSRYYISDGGIVFGSLEPDFDWPFFMEKHKNKFDQVAELISKLNKAFKTEPILYVDISSGDANEAGWTQNSIYFSADYLNFSDDIEDLLQSAGHEACERWQSKGFIDVELSKDYLQLMGEEYSGSELEKFRLKNRFKRQDTNAGHPWDGEREFIAELGSTLLVDPNLIGEIFDSSRDLTALRALDHLQNKLNRLE